MKVERPRARSVDGHELSLPSWQAWSARDPLDERAFEQMVLGVSTRRYARSLEALPNEFEVHGVGKSAVSERFVVGTQRRLSELMRRDLSGLALVALMIDGVHFAEHVVLAAVGIESNASPRSGSISASARFALDLGSCHSCSRRLPPPSPTLSFDRAGIAATSISTAIRALPYLEVVQAKRLVMRWQWTTGGDPMRPAISRALRSISSQLISAPSSSSLMRSSRLRHTGS
ncbi:MAG: hypothetical protein WBE69_17055, partial [Candidatus Binataceae bacterium]